MSHYFSRAQLLDRPLDMALLASLSRHGDAYRDHALVWRLFPGDNEQRDFLFRRELDARGKAFYYVVSARAPIAEAGLLAVQSKPYAPVFESGDWVRFDLRANPTVARRDAAGGKSRRHDVLMEAKRQGASLPEASRNDLITERSLAWLSSRGEDWGLEFQEESVLTTAYTQHRLHHKKRSIEFSSFDYQGLAQVTDPARLAAKLVGGVGHARAFGCGLLLVKRVS
ncbi:type I-E CRISPR-associated protein Cas6/Cse3/CasE [Pigmentiphaga aceris]|uniref:Type I-E CRISPR-associated protein Cas6/Cse3/CasE n=1 Tax=Pigmentiphaga aceris TaxID=1940612 RepID=A0A5C0B1M9_9BURK|nr:type I-E CRISPR-associated protein Cas6/Cse3/CasE [Pigmentiphaga aceris]QEI07673.1 type I-E CRISPR-associated protein Cas6/Cse3/CasE [Pigmentiphaga aceris]